MLHPCIPGYLGYKTLRLAQILFFTFYSTFDASHRGNKGLKSCRDKKEITNRALTVHVIILKKNIKVVGGEEGLVHHVAADLRYDYVGREKKAGGGHQ